MTQKLRYAMIGGGRDAFIGSVHRKAMALDALFEFTSGALSSTPEKAKISGRELGLKDERNHGTWQELLADELKRPANERVDLIVIVTPNHQHFPIAKAFTEAGFNVVCDKPLVHSSEEANQLIKAQQQSETIFAVTYNYTGYPLIKEARERIKNGELGKIRKVIVEYNQGWLAQSFERASNKQAAWRTDPKQSGIAGCIGDIGSHAENLVSAVTGLEIEAICADLTHFTNDFLDDDASLLLRFTSGAKGVLIASQICVGFENGLRLRVFGDKATLIWGQENPNELLFLPLNAPAQILTRNAPYLCDAAKTACRLPGGHPEGFIEAFANLYGAIYNAICAKKAGQKIDNFDFPTLQDGARGVKFIEKTVQSALAEQKWTAF